MQQQTQQPNVLQKTIFTTLFATGIVIICCIIDILALTVSYLFNEIYQLLI